LLTQQAPNAFWTTGQCFWARTPPTNIRAINRTTFNTFSRKFFIGSPFGFTQKEIHPKGYRREEEFAGKNFSVFLLILFESMYLCFYSYLSYGELAEEWVYLKRKSRKNSRIYA
jgi:hypothetical protein